MHPVRMAKVVIWPTNITFQPGAIGKSQWVAEQGGELWRDGRRVSDGAFPFADHVFTVRANHGHTVVNRNG